MSPFSIWLILRCSGEAMPQVATMVATVGACAAPTAAMVGVGPSRIPPTIVSVMATCDSDPAGVVQSMQGWYNRYNIYIYIFILYVYLIIYVCV
jgi:hypothetical protein